MGATYAEVTIRPFNGTSKSYTQQFLVDTGATDSIAPSVKLAQLGIKKVGAEAYELADGRVVTFDFGLAQIEVMGRITAGRIIFGPDDAEPILGLVALESAALKVNPQTQQLEKLPAGMLK